MFKKTISFLLILSLLWADIAFAMQKSPGGFADADGEDKRNSPPIKASSLSKRSSSLLEKGEGKNPVSSSSTSSLLQKNENYPSNGSSSKNEENAPLLDLPSSSKNEPAKKERNFQIQDENQDAEHSSLIPRHTADAFPIRNPLREGDAPFSPHSSLKYTELEDVIQSHADDKGFDGGTTSKISSLGTEQRRDKRKLKTQQKDEEESITLRDSFPSTHASSHQEEEEQALLLSDSLSLQEKSSDNRLFRIEDDADLKTAEQRLRKAERRPFFVKWVYMDHLLEKIAYFLSLKKNHVTGAPSIGSCDLKPLWIEGQGIPLKSGYSLARGMSGFRQGVEFVFNRSLSLILQGLVGYQIYENIYYNKTFSPLPVLEILWKGDEQSIRGALSVIVQNPDQAPYFFSFFAAPILWGLVKAGLFARTALQHTPENFAKSVKILEDFTLTPTEEGKGKGKRSLWKDNLRWILPLHPIDREVNYLVYHLLLDGNLTLEQREAAFKALIDLTRNTQGWSKVVGLTALQKLASSTSLKQLALVKKAFGEDYKETLLREKVHALNELYKQNPGLTKAGIKGGAHNLYAHYLRWTLGDFDSTKSAIAWGLFKWGKVAVSLNLFLKIADQIISYLKCPKPLQEGFTSAMNPAGYASSYNSKCLQAYLDNFNQVPGQPAETLVKILPLFQNIDPTQFTTLNFTGRGVTGTQVGGLLRGFKAFQPNINFSALDLSNNNIGAAPEDMEALTSSLPSSLTYLDLSRNKIGCPNSGNDHSCNTEAAETNERALGRSLPSLSHLRTLKLSTCSIGRTQDNGTIAIGNGLTYLMNLQILDFSLNQIGYTGDNGTVALGNTLLFLTNLQTLDLSWNQIGYSGDSGTVAIANAFPSLPTITYLDLSHNNIVETGDNGTVAIGNGLPFLKNLQILNLGGNGIGIRGDNGTLAIANALPFLSNLTYLDLSRNNFESVKSAIDLMKSLQSLKALNTLYLERSSGILLTLYLL